MASSVTSSNSSASSAENANLTAGFTHDPLRILVLWENSDSGREALECAAWIGRTTRIEVQCVTTFLRPWSAPKVSKMSGKYKKWFKKETHACATAVKEALQDVGIAPEQWNEEVSIFRDGTNGANMVLDTANNFDADLVLLGSSAFASKGRLFTNSTADALLHSSTRALALTPRKPKLSKKGVTRINFAMLEPEIDPDTLLHVAHIAASWGTNLRIVALSPSGFGEPPISESLEIPENLTLEWRENTFAQLDRCRDQIHSVLPQVHVATEIGFGNGWAGALDAIKWKKGDLLCLGSTPVGALERVFIGSATSEVLANTHVPVFIIPAKVR